MALSAALAAGEFAWSDRALAGHAAPVLNLRAVVRLFRLGYWTPEEEKEADLAVQGRHYETGEKQKQGRRKFDE